LPLLDRVKIVSARSTYEHAFPNDAVKWKFMAFETALLEIFGSGQSVAKKNVLSFGDSHVEREAVLTVSRSMCNAQTKSVKFAERPTLEQLRREVELVNKCLDYLHTHEGDLDLQLTVTFDSQTEAPAPAAMPAGSPTCPPPAAPAAVVAGSPTICPPPFAIPQNAELNEMKHRGPDAMEQECKVPAPCYATALALERPTYGADCDDSFAHDHKHCDVDSYSCPPDVKVPAILRRKRRDAIAPTIDGDGTDLDFPTLDRRYAIASGKSVSALYSAPSAAFSADAHKKHCVDQAIVRRTSVRDLAICMAYEPAPMSLDY